MDSGGIGPSVAAWAESVEAVIALGGGFTGAQWDARTECPAWTVRDVYAHLAGGERWMADGHPERDAGPGSVADAPVAARRDIPGPAVLSELREVYAHRRHQIDAVPEDPAAATLTAYGAPTTVDMLYRLRAFDVWVHEQDIRRAVGIAGNLGTAGARIARDIFVPSLARTVAKRAAAPAGSVVRITVTGPVAADVVVTVDADGRGRLAPATGDPATAGLAMDWETFSRLAAGRIDPATAPVEVTGDTDLAGRVLRNLAVTP